MATARSKSAARAAPAFQVPDVLPPAPWLQSQLAQLLAQRFRKATARFGLNRQRVELDLTRFCKPALPRSDGQQELFA